MKLNKENMIITIDSEFCSRGEEIGRALALSLGIPCYGEEILPRAASLSGIPETLLRRCDGRALTAAYDLTARELDGIKLPSAREMITAQVFAARQLAKEGPCVLVDRFAGFALAGTEHISVFIRAEREDRLRVYAEKEGLPAEKAEKGFRRADRAWRGLYLGNDRGWGSAGNYELSLNASDAGVNAMAGTILSFLEAMTGEQLVNRSAAQAG